MNHITPEAAMKALVDATDDSVWETLTGHDVAALASMTGLCYSCYLSAEELAHAAQLWQRGYVRIHSLPSQVMIETTKKGMAWIRAHSCTIEVV